MIRYFLILPTIIQSKENASIYLYIIFFFFNFSINLCLSIWNPYLTYENIEFNRFFFNFNLCFIVIFLFLFYFMQRKLWIHFYGNLFTQSKIVLIWLYESFFHFIKVYQMLRAKREKKTSTKIFTYRLDTIYDRLTHFPKKSEHGNLLKSCQQTKNNII